MIAKEVCIHKDDDGYYWIDDLFDEVNTSNDTRGCKLFPAQLKAVLLAQDRFFDAQKILKNAYINGSSV